MGNEFIKRIYYEKGIYYEKLLNHNILMKTKKKLNSKKNGNFFTRKKNNYVNKKSEPLQQSQSINQFHKYIYIKNKNTSDLDFKEDFLSSCFKYYYGKIKICNNNFKNKSCKNIGLTKSFLQVKSKGSLVIIDYPNIIYILYEHYKDKNKVIQCFYEFIYKELKENTKFYIISKIVIIDNIWTCCKIQKM